MCKQIKMGERLSRGSSRLLQTFFRLLKKLHFRIRHFSLDHFQSLRIAAWIRVSHLKRHSKMEQWHADCAGWVPVAPPQALHTAAPSAQLNRRQCTTAACWQAACLERRRSRGAAAAAAAERREKHLIKNMICGCVLLPQKTLKTG